MSKSARSRSCSLSMLLAACAAAQPADRPLLPAAADPTRQPLERLLQSGVATPLTLFPVRVLGRASTDVAEVLGLVLERQGMSDLQLAPAAFEVGDTDWLALPTQFAAQVRATAAAASPARASLYAEFLGDPTQGPTEVRFVLVDGAGEVVLVDRQLPADAAFRRTAGRDPDPLGCARLVAERLFELAGWRVVPGGVADGVFARRWQQKSGLPDRAERAAIERRASALREQLATARFVVLPTLWSGAEVVDTDRLAAQVVAALGCKSAVAGTHRLATAATANQQQRLWSLAKELQQFQQQQPVDADYVLVVDIGLAPGGKAGFVDLVVVDRAGAVVLADFQNDQHAAFRRRAPTDLATAEAVATDRLRELLR